jgi:hypothetical protein
MSLEQEMAKMVTAPPSRKDAAKNLFTRTARGVFSVLNRAHGDRTDDYYMTEYSKCAYTYKYAETSPTEYSASDDDANEDSHSIDSEVGAVVSHDASDDTSEDSNAVDTNAANTSNCMGTESSDKCVWTAADEMESYQGDGYSPRKFEHEVKVSESWSRAIWAAARDDFDFIVEDLANSVSIARLRLASDNHKEILDPNLCLDKANMMRYKHQDVTAMKSWSSIPDEEKLDALEETRQP